MAAADKADIVRDLFAAYMANDRKAVENAFTEDFRFTTPHDDEIDKATYFERCWKVSDWIERQQLERIFVEGDRIKSIDVYFGATYQDGAFVRQQG